MEESIVQRLQALGRRMAKDLALVALIGNVILIARFVRDFDLISLAFALLAGLSALGIVILSPPPIRNRKVRILFWIVAVTFLTWLTYTLILSRASR